MSEAPAPDYFEPAEWDAHQQIVAEAIALMQRAIADEPDSQQSLQALRKQIDSFQGDDYRNFQWGMTVHFVRSGNLPEGVTRRPKGLPLADFSDL